jgi:hypothetical protein
MNRFAQPRYALLGGIMLLVAITAVVGERLAVRSYSTLSCIVEDNRTGGGSGIRAWADKMGFSTRPLQSPIDEVERELPKSGHCLITAGNGSWNRFGEFPHENWLALRKWISVGNTLIVVTSNSVFLPEPIHQHFTIADSKANSSRPVNDALPPSIQQPASDPFSLAKVEYELVSTRWGGELSVKSKGPRLKNSPREWQIAGQGTTAVLVGKSLEQGMVYLLLDDSAWNNEGFDRSDNAATLGRVLKQNLGDGGVFAFDEYRHGRGRIESLTTLFLSIPAAQSFAWMAGLWGVFWLWSATRRLSPPDEFREVERRTALEYIESVAAMNQRARAAPLAVKSVLQRVRYLLQKRGLIDQNMEVALERADRQAALAARPAMPVEEMKIVSELIQLRKERYGTRQGS